jgi:putative spermidine/putrescine transport system substrate-binding protein
MSRTSRRRTAGAVLAAVALAATACTSSATGAGGTATTVIFQGFAGVFQDAFTAAVIEPFQTAHPDIRIDYQPVKNSAQVLAGLRSAKSRPTVDVALVDSSVAPTANQEGLFAKLDKEKVPNLGDLDPAAVDPDGYGPGLTFDSLSIIYDTRQVADPPTSWHDLWRPEFDGKLVLPIADTRGIALIRVLDEIAGADYRQTIDPAIARLKELAPTVQTWDPQPDIYTAVASGAAAIGVGWNARGQLFHDTTGGDVQAVLPAEGTVSQVNTINLVAGAPDAGAAQTFIDYALSPEAQQAFAEKAFYAPTNTKAKPGQDVLNRTAASPEQAAKEIELDWRWITPVYADWVDRIKREVIGG